MGLRKDEGDGRRGRRPGRRAAPRASSWRRRDWPAVAGFAAFFVAFFPQAVFAGKFLVAGDAFYYSYPLRTVAWATLRAGRLPLWTPHILSGFPVLAMPQLALGYPLTWGYAFLPGHWAEQIYVLAPYLLAPAFTYAYCRELKRSRTASALAGLAFAYGGAMCGPISNSGMLTNGMMWLPLALLAVERARRARSSFALCLAGGGAAYSMSVLNGHAQTFVYAGLLLAAYGLFLSLFPRAPHDPDGSNDEAPADSNGGADADSGDGRAADSRNDGRAAPPRAPRRWRPLAVSLCSIAAGAGLAAFQLFETARAARLSTRTALAFETFGEGSFKFAEAVRAALAPLHALADVTPYVAPLALALAAVTCVAAARAKEARDARVLFWLGVAAVAWLLMLGSNTPLHGAIFRLPVVNRFRVPSRHAFEWTLALSVLAAYGWDRLDAFFARGRARAGAAAGAASRRRTLTGAGVNDATLKRDAPRRAPSGHEQRRRASSERGAVDRPASNPAAFALLLAAAVVVGALFWRAANLPPAHGSRLDTGLGERAYLVWKLAFTALLFASLLSAWRLRGARLRALALASCVALACFVEANAFVWRKWGRLSLDAERFAAVSRATRLVAERPPHEGRVYTRVDLFVEEFARTPRLEGPNLTALHGLHNVAGVEPLIPARYSLALGGVGPDSVNVRAGFPDNLWLFGERSRALDLLNTTHLVSFAGLRKSPDPPLARDGLNFARADLQISLAPGWRAELPAADASADALALVTSLSNSVEEAQGAEVAKIILRAADGATSEAALRAGADTSEWAHERADVRASVRHSLAPVFDSAPGDASNSFRSHRYLARVRAGEARRVNRVEIVNTSRRATLVVSKVSVIDSGSGASVPLYRAPGANWEAVYERDDALVLRNRRALPRAWLVSRAESVGADEALRAIRGEGEREFDPLRTALLEVGPDELPSLPNGAAVMSGAAGAGMTSGDAAAAGAASRDAGAAGGNLIAAGGGAGAVAGSARVTAYEPAALAIETESETPALLVVSETFYPGWEASVDGRPAKIFNTNYLLRGVAVPAGRHRVEMRYRAPLVLRGALVSSLTLLALGVLTFTALARRRPLVNLKRPAHSNHA